MFVPDAFFQVNTLGAESLLTLLRAQCLARVVDPSLRAKNQLRRVRRFRCSLHASAPPPWPLALRAGAARNRCTSVLGDSSGCASSTLAQPDVGV